MDSDKEVWDDFFPFFIVKKWLLAKSGIKFKFSILRASQVLLRKRIKGEEGETNAYKASKEKSYRQKYGSKDVLLSFLMCSLSKWRRNLSLEICVIIFI